MKRNHRFLASGVALALLILGGTLVSGVPAWSQEVTATITGTVTDPSGAPVAGATVTATSQDRGTDWTTQTDNTGLYYLTRIPVGAYTLKIEAKGFSTTVRPAFTLVLNQVARVDAQLKVGQVSEVVEVTSAAPVLQTDSTDLGTLIDSRAAVALPLATRNINELTLLAPGVVSPNIFAFQAPQTTFGTGRPYVNGAREQDNNFSLDGMDTNQPDNNEVSYVPTPDAVQEFNLIAGNAPADFGNYIGGVVVETLKSGTNSYHGDIWEFLRNTSLDANSWQNKAVTFFNEQPGGNGQVVPRAPLHWNDFGATFGGPIIKNKLFFFADWQSSLYNTPASPTTFAPIPAGFRTGDFSSLCANGFDNSGVCKDRAPATTAPTGTVCAPGTPPSTLCVIANQIFDPASSAVPANRTPFPMNQVPIRSNAAKAILGSPLFPAANVSTYLQNSYINSHQGDMKIDWAPTDKDHVSGRWSQQYVINNTANSIALFPDLKREYPLKNFVVDYSRAISPTLVNDVRFGFQDFPANDQVFTNPTGQNLPALFGIPGVQDTVLPSINFAPYTAIGSADLVEIFHDTTVEAEDSLTWTHGNHSLHFGFEYFHYLMNDLYPGNQGLAGSFTFNGQFTGNTGTTGASGNSVADFVLGLPSDVQQGTPLHFHLRNSLFGGFVQDNWRVTSHLTLNLGLRYELTTARGDKDSALNINFNKITGAPEIGTNYNTYTGIDNLQPRIGFAWQPGWVPNTVVRGAYGISTYMEGNGVNNLAIINPPNVVSRDENNTGLPEPVTTLDQGYSAFPAAACTTAALQTLSPNCLSSVTVHATNPNLQPAVDQQWNFTIQHQFGSNTTVSAGYVGNKIDHMTDIFLLNQGIIQNSGCPVTSPCVVPGPFAQPLIDCCGTTANPSAKAPSVRYNDSEAIQRFNALELQLVERAYRGLQFTANYTWSKCLSNSLGYFGQYGDEEGIGQSQTNGGYFFFQNIYNQKADYGRCINDVGSAFNGYMIYDLPFGHGRQFGSGVNGVVNQVIGGWSLAADFNIHSGFAINPAAPDQSQTGGGVGAAYRPNCVAGVAKYGNGALEDIGGNIGVQFLNPAAVALPGQFTFGNCGVGAFRGPSLTTADLNLTKQFHITERFNLQFMAQFINVTNTPIFGAPAASCGPACDGVISTGSKDAGTFGLAQSSDPGREIQFGLKLLF